MTLAWTSTINESRNVTTRAAAERLHAQKSD